MSYDSLVSRNDYLSAHYLDEQLPKDIKRVVVPRWDERERSGQKTPRIGLRGLRRDYFKHRAFFADFAERSAAGGSRRLDDVAEWRKSLNEVHGDILRALAFEAAPRELIVERSDHPYEIAVAYADPAVIAIECGWAPDVDAALDPDQAGLLLTPVRIDNREQITSGVQLASWLFAADEPPRYVLLLAGGVVILADQTTWGDRRYLAVSLDIALDRRDLKELDTIGALFGADSLLPPEEGGAEPLEELLTSSRQHAVGVSKELRDGLKESVEIIANEVLDRLREQEVAPEQIGEPAALAKELARESLRYLYRILFLLYAEARPELGVLPSDHEEYVKGYGLGRLGDLVIRDLVGEESRGGFHLYESLDLLFRMVNEGHRARGGAEQGVSEGEGIRFEPLKADLFDPARTRLIGTLVAPGHDEDEPTAPRVDTRLRNVALYKVLRLLMLARGKRHGRGGFISYAQLGINQLGAVYEGLMSYTGFIADEELYEVAKGGDPKDGSWMIPASKVDDYEDAVFVRRSNGERVRYKAGAFVYRLAGRDRQTSASYYTPESLTKVTVELALQHRLDPDDTTTSAREILNWTICEPALGSGAFLNEAINQVAAAYLKRRQAELGIDLDPEPYTDELQKVKAYIALHNSYGVDLNETAVELAEVSLWLNVMYPGLQAPWFGLHLRRGNSLIGAGRRVYHPDQLKKKEWLTAAPDDHPFAAGAVPAGHVHHFLLPAQGWGAVAAEKEAKALAPDEAKALGTWRNTMRRSPSTRSQFRRLQGLARRVEFLWGLVHKRLEISEREIRREIDVWGADWIEHPEQAVAKEKIYGDLIAPGTPYWRLKKIMDAWCALWFWPLDKVGLLNGSDEVYLRLGDAEDSIIEIIEELTETSPAAEAEPVGMPIIAEQDSLFGESPRQLPLTSSPARRSKPKSRTLPPVRPIIPLADLDDWLDFAEAIIGRADIPPGSIVHDFDNLPDLEAHEDELPLWMGMDSFTKLGERFPCLRIIDDIADQHGFFHWELHFAQIFQNGGFDLQVGNPPWVRPEWEEADVLAELMPWFKLAETPSPGEWRDRKLNVLTEVTDAGFFLEELAKQTGLSAFLGSDATYSLLVGTRPDFYRAFMMRTWGNLGQDGTVGLLHPDTHLTGDKERRLRAAAYPRLRLHADFVNSGNRFFPPPLSRTMHFGVHIYGSPKDIGFDHLSWLFSTVTLTDSFQHDGSGTLPGVKYGGSWDERPHLARIVRVDHDVLGDWLRLSGDEDGPVEQARLLYPVSTAEQGAIEALGEVAQRLGRYGPRISQGYNETNAVKDGLIRRDLSDPEDWSNVILKGPQIGVATPFFKQPPNTGTKGRPQDLTKLEEDALPRSEYAPAADIDSYYAGQDLWVDHRELVRLLSTSREVELAREKCAVTQGVLPSEIPDKVIEDFLSAKAQRRYTEFYRLAWRRMIPDNTDRSLFPAVYPPGPAHVHTVHTLALPDNMATILVAGFWSALPIDYLLRITGTADLQTTNTKMLPAPEPDHPLAVPLLLRALRLNCLTSAYSDLWDELYDSTWCNETWAVDWPRLEPVGVVREVWGYDTPLRTEFERRAALVEIDALVSVWLGLTADQLVAIYKARFPQLYGYEAEMWFDAGGRKITANWNSFGSGQTKEHYEQLVDYLQDEEHVSPPDGYEPPFFRADREGEYRQAHAVFAERLRRARAGKEQDGGTEQ